MLWEKEASLTLSHVLPLSDERLDIAAYTYSYHMDGGIVKMKDAFWGDGDVRSALLRLRFDEHGLSHRASCFKKGCECRFYFPFQSCANTDIVPDDEYAIDWYRLNGKEVNVAPWMIESKRSMGSQYLNTCNAALTQVLNSNPGKWFWKKKKAL